MVWESVASVIGAMAGAETRAAQLRQRDAQLAATHPNQRGAVLAAWARADAEEAEQAKRRRKQWEREMEESARRNQETNDMLLAGALGFIVANSMQSDPTPTYDSGGGGDFSGGGASSEF